ncbi:lipoate--protein ligase [Clostridium ganghwense]|uniref:lipoate--protein ligase n=1 Tax=Clostridium ganghwense TaxID=312089 RepID=A0ABT4CPM4_9CLOT|nr:lipoate--protein ligase [Clostridium ganghwense]MCY6371005.1 lipoate--protein ligase [Clostridium ganghwense]
MKYIENNFLDSHYNLALEEYVFKKLNYADEYVILWRNEPSIIVGKNQNTIEEINFQYVKERNINVVRRITGGGAVYHDLGNLNFTFITNAQDIREIDFKKYTIPVRNALKSMGINAELTGRNDITIDGKKISGISQSIYKKRVLNHGTLLFNSDLNALQKALKVKKEKFQSKGVKSVRGRVTNISKYLNKNINIEVFRELILKYIFEFEGSKIERCTFNKEQLEAIEKLVKEKYSTWQWNYGKSPAFNYKNYKRFSGGGIEVALDIKDGIIKQCNIHGDFLGTKDIKNLEKMIEGIRYKKEEIKTILYKVDINRYFANISSDEVLACFFD